MSDRKNIDRLFQEKFKDFEVTPDEMVWKKIKARQKEDKKRVLFLPLWYRAAGIAVLIALMTGGSFLYFDNDESQKITITDTNKNTPTKDALDTSSDPDPIIEHKIENEEIVYDTQKNDVITQTKNPSTVKAIISKPPKTIKPVKQLISPTQKNVAEAQHSHQNLSKQQDVSTPLSDHTQSFTNQPIKKYIPNNKEQVSGIAKHDFQKENSLPHQKMTNDHPDIPAKKDIEEIALTKTDSQNTNGKKSIFDEVAKNEKESVPEETETTSKKWNIAPNIAPVYYNTIGNASSIDPKFSDNDKNGQVNMSYGVQISYAVNDRFSIRSGLNNVDLGYQTENVGFTPTTSSQNLQSINYNTTSDIILISDLEENPKISTDIRKNPNTPAQNSGLLNQSINYLEIPLEMKYAIVDKKIGINMIGGVSTLLLQKNKIYIETGDFETLIGEANNLNNLSFTGNIGLGVDYELSDQFEINLEPIFKYQFNALNETTDFKPYYFGIYTGINIKF